MSAKPWIAWYMADYRAKTMHLSFCESEAYRRLLEAYYSSGGPLPSEHNGLCRLTSAQDESEREAVRRVAAEFFTENGGRLHHSRCDEEIEKAQAAHNRWVEGGRKGGLSSAKGRLKPSLKGGLRKA